jgi:hypothetical protein
VEIKRIALFGLLILSIGVLAFISLRVLKINIPFVEFIEETSFEKKNATFSIGIFEGNDPFHLSETRAIGNPVLTASDVNDADAAFVADPFMVREKNSWYMFFEVMNNTSGNGDVGLASSKDGLSWEYQQIVLDEPFHLSYPHVFLNGTNYYMILETNKEKMLRLYKSTAFPLTWQYETTLLSGLQYSDSTIFQHEGKWWIFTETDPVGDGTLRLFYSMSIYGPWQEHPSSPIINGDENIARPAGKVLFYQNKLFRVAQDDWPTYGNQVRMFQIDELTTTSYAEHELCGYPELTAEGISARLKVPAWRFDGYHHLDLHQIEENHWIACMDGVTRTSIFSQWKLKFQIPFTKNEM